jgi:type 1 glutamine amidotransferase
MRWTKVGLALVGAVGLCLSMATTAAAQAENQPPTVSASRNPAGNVRVGVPIAFTAAASDPDGDSLTYLWDFGDGTTSTEQNPTKHYLAAATRTVTVSVSDGRGGSATSAPLTVVVQSNRAPQTGGLTMSPQAGVAPVTVTWGGAATDQDGPSHLPLSYAWDLDGDGADDTTAQNPTHTYTTPGTYLPRVRVTDQFGGVANRTFVVNVIPAERDPSARFRILVFSKTGGFRHSSIDEGIAALKLLGSQQAIQVDAIEESTLFTDAVLSRYDAVVFLSTTGEVLNDEQQAAFERYIRSGRGYAGIHAAADTEYLWPWYGQLVGGYFRNHPPGAPAATVVTEDAAHHSTRHLPARWDRLDEWYNYQSPVNPSVNGGGNDYSVRDTAGTHVLLKMDESTYNEQDGNTADDDHPISWCKRYDGGRMWYTGMGHTEASYLDAGFMQHILGGLEVAAGVVTDAACGVTSRSVPVDVSGTVPGTLALAVAPSATFGAFTPGITEDYTTTLAASVTSTGGDALLGVADAGASPGHLVNGAHVMPQALRLSATSAAGTGSPPAALGAGPLPLLSYAGPVSSDQVTVDLTQPIASTDGLRTGTYSKTLTFTLSTTAP